MILDTQYLGALADERGAARALAHELTARQVPTRIPTAVIWEAYTGINNAADEDMADLLRARYEQLVASRGSVGLTPAVARRAGKLNGEHMNSDRLSDLDGVDSIVAAHGLLLDEPVLSNDGDFQDVEGLEVVTY
ncbi:PIN domain-containing protein [Haloplanus pelagicus]|jgi:predicted nucleic acid-binding protein|uniref:PIN domain-containing protein n=1 Tax=Haloplanus pelagicus TaxID=2949995 RepID=UPI00203B8938|nr:PIN domain-containing protein [Haloplanus sp. HW8-1]